VKGRGHKRAHAGGRGVTDRWLALPRLSAGAKGVRGGDPRGPPRVGHVRRGVS
jgi:hypothetical protein